jgi:hypothetical protein
MSNDPLIRHIADASLNRLAKWRGIYAGWQLGTRARGDGESEAVRDHREVTLLLRAEVSALAGLLIAKGVFTADEFTQACGEEAEYLSKALEKKFPGARATDDGMSLDVKEFAETQRRLGFPP